MLTEKGITQKKLAEMTGLREATISSLARNAMDKINYHHLGKIMVALNLTDFNHIFELDEE